MRITNEKLGNIIETLTDYHANGSYERLKENVELLPSENYAVMIRTTNFSQNNFYENLNYITESAYNYLKKSKVYAGDIVMNKIADAGACYFMPEIRKPVSLGMNLFLIRINKQLANSFFIYSYLKFHEFYVKSFASGSATKTITKEDVRKLKIYLPEIGEQHKIANILGTWDKAISTTERLIANSKQQKKALMQQLLTGKKRLLDDSGKPFEGEWEEVMFGDCIEHTGGTALEKHVIDNAQHHFISIGNYSMDGKYIDKGQRIELNSKTKTKLLNKNDLVMVLNDKTKTGDIIGSTILIDEDNKYIYNQRSERIVPNKEINVSFFWYLLNSFHIRTEVFSRSQGGTQIYVNFGALKSIALNLPKQEEQKRIATILTNAYKEIELLEQQLTDLKQEKKALMQQLLTGKRRVKVDNTEVA